MKKREPLRFKLGKLPAQPEKMKFDFGHYLSMPDLPKPPKVFGAWQHFWNLGMYGNDTIGDCVLAGAANETAIWNHDARGWVKFTEADIVSDYSAMTGYVPGDKSTDNGVGMSDGAAFRRKTGITDHNGKKHVVDAYAKLPRGDYDSLKLAMWLGGAAAIGIAVPDYFQQQWDDEVPWSVKANYKILGGHYIPGVGIDEKGNIVVVSWGRYQKMTRAAYEKFSDEACMYISVERLINRTSPEGFRDDVLLSDLKALKEPGGWGSEEESWFSKWFKGDLTLRK